jgi:hypothetical protein
MQPQGSDRRCRDHQQVNRSATGREHRKFKRPLQAPQAQGQPDTTPDPRSGASIHGQTRRLEARPDTSRAASHGRAPGYTRDLRSPAGVVPLAARSAVPAARHVRQPRCAFGGCGALAQTPEAPLHQIRAQPGSVRPGLNGLCLAAGRVCRLSRACACAGGGCGTTSGRSLAFGAKTP